MGVQKSAEAIVAWSPSIEGLNMGSRLEASPSMMVGVAERSAEMRTLIHKEREQNSQQLGAKATNITVGKEHLHEKSTDLLS